MSVTISEASGRNDALYGKYIHPIAMCVQHKAEAFEQESVLPKLFKMRGSNHYAEAVVGMTAFGDFMPVGENGPTPQDSVEQGYDKFIVNETWKNGFSISREMVDDGKIENMKDRAENFVTGYHRTRERFGAALYAGAMGGGQTVKFGGKEFDITGADKLPVFHTAHKAKVKGANQCNCFSDAFSVDALGRMEEKMHLFRGENDEILNVQPNTILIPADADLKKEVFAAIGADKDPATANNGFNYQYGRWNVICWPYLNQFLAAGIKPWVLLDPEYNEQYAGAVWLDRVKLEVQHEIDRNTHALKYDGYARFAAGFADWRFAAVGGVAGGKSLTE